ncbi:MAG TPA: hypothetical protein VM686_05500 [Polyangiaceae bacterium]|nr:hypothetical protein [Polyangiaceae bacterium]
MASNDDGDATKKSGTLLGLGEEAVKATSAVAAQDEPDDEDDEEEETKVRTSPSSTGPAAEKFKGTMMGLGDEPSKAPAAESGEATKFKGTMMGLGDEPKKAPAKAESGERKFSGTMVGIGDPGAIGTAKTEAAPVREDLTAKAKPSEKKEGLGSTLVMDKEPPAKTKTVVIESNPAPTERRIRTKSSTTQTVDKGKTLPLPVESPVAKREAKSSSPPPAAEEPSSGKGVWFALAAVAAAAAIWVLTKPSEEQTPAAVEPVAEATSTAEPAPPPEPAAAVAEPEVRPVEPAPTASAAPAATVSAAPPEPKVELPKIEKHADVAPKAKPKPVREPPRPAVIDTPTSNDEKSLAPTLAARVAVGKNSLPASRCRQKPDPAGTADTVVTFAPSGQVTAVRVLDSYAATRTATCLEERLKQVSMEPFSGDDVTVRVPIQLF